MHIATHTLPLPASKLSKSKSNRVAEISPLAHAATAANRLLSAAHSFVTLAPISHLQDEVPEIEDGSQEGKKIYCWKNLEPRRKLNYLKPQF